MQKSLANVFFFFFIFIYYNSQRFPITVNVKQLNQKLNSIFIHNSKFSFCFFKLHKLT